MPRRLENRCAMPTAKEFISDQVELRELHGVAGRPPLEAQVENGFLSALVRFGELLCIEFKTRKMNGEGFNSWPDRLIIGPKNFSMYIEFKRPPGPQGGKGGQLSPGQEDVIDMLKSMGHIVEVHNDRREALRGLEIQLRKAKVI